MEILVELEQVGVRMTLWLALLWWLLMYNCTGLSTNLQLMTNPFNYLSSFPLTNYMKLFGTSLLRPVCMVPDTVQPQPPLLHIYSSPLLHIYSSPSFLDQEHLWKQSSRTIKNCKQVLSLKCLRSKDVPQFCQY